jgi:hypothetical protein
MQQVKNAQTRALARRLKVDPRFVDAFLEEVRRREPTASLSTHMRTRNSGPRIVVRIEYGDMLELERCPWCVMVSSYTPDSDWPGLQYSSLIIEESITDQDEVQAMQRRWSDIKRVTLAELPAVFAKRNVRLYKRVEKIRSNERAEEVLSKLRTRRWWHIFAR